MENTKKINMLDDPLYHNLLDCASKDEIATGKLRKRRSCGRRSCCRSTCCKFFLIFGIIVCIGLGVAVYITTYVEDGVRGIVVSQLPLAEGSQRALDWSKGQPPLNYRIYVFNLTNPKEFLNGGRPRLIEVGPLVYQVVETKEQAVFNGSTVTFRSKPVFVFQKELSVEGGEDVEIFTLNVPLVNAGELTRGPALGTAFSVIREAYSFDSVKLLTVRELLWGHKSRVLDFAKQLKDIPYPYDYFALLAGRNNTLQPLTTINTGVDDVYKISEFLAYDGPGPRTGCNAYRGTDGSGFGPNINTSRVLFIYNGQFCRSLPLVYQKTVHNQGLTAYRFVLPEDVFTYSETSGQNQGQNASRNSNVLYGNMRFGHYNGVLVSKSAPNSTQITEKPSSWKDVYGGNNKCFCNKGKCPPDGVLDMKPCLYGAAVGFSFPHYLNADPALRHMVHGMRPDPSKHNTEFDVFPDLGIPVRVKLRMQMNIVLDQNQALNRARHFDLIYPVFWFEAGIDGLPPNLAEKLRMAQDLPSLARTIVLVLCGLLTVVFFIVLMVLVILSWHSSDHNSSSSLSSTHDTRSTTPDYDGSHFKRGGRDASAPEVGEVQGLLNDGTYTSFERTHSIVTHDIPILITDHHTLLPPYKIARNESQASDLFNDANDSFGRDVLDSAGEQTSDIKPANVAHDNHEIDEAANDYPPPCYEVAALPGVFTSSSSESNSSSVSVSADVHHSASYVDVRRLGNSSPIQTSEEEIAPTNPPQSPIEFPIENRSSLGKPDLGQAIVQNHVIAFAAPKVVSETLKRQGVSPPSEITPPGSSEEINLPDCPSVDGDAQNDKKNLVPLATSSPQETDEEIQPSHAREEDTSQSSVEPDVSGGRPPSPNTARDGLNSRELLQGKYSSSRPLSKSLGESPDRLAPLESDL